MNVFVLDYDTKKCAQMHCDKHVVKMILETAQLLCGSHWMLGSRHTAPYKLSHKNHPCSRWVRECLENYVWLCDLGIELCKEYTYRYGKRHKSQDIIEWCMIYKPNIKELGDITPFPLAMPDECKVPGNSLQSYHNYYVMKKGHLWSWKGKINSRTQPQWFIKMVEPLSHGYS